MAARRFGIITEIDARQIERGATVALDRGGHVTPLAWDTLRERRVTVVPSGSVDPALPADLAPVTPVVRVAIGADHTGLALKTALIDHLRKAGKAVTDHGTATPDAVDYPDIAATVGGRWSATSRCRHRDRRRLPGIGDRRQQDPGRPAAMCPTRRSRVRARAQRRERADARRHAVSPAEARRSSTLSVDAHARGQYLRRLLKIRGLEDRF